MESILILVIPAIVKLIGLLNEKNWKSAGKIILSALIGLAAGYFGINGLTIEKGIQAGLSASGIVTVASYAGIKKENK